MRVGELVGNVHHRHGRDSRRLQPFRHLLGAEAARPRRDDLVHIAAVGPAGRFIGEPGVVGQAGVSGASAFDDSSQCLPLVLGAHGDGDPGVVAGAGIIVVRREVRVVVAGRNRDLARHLVLQHRRPQQRGSALQVGGFHVLALAGAVAMPQRRHDPQRRAQGGHRIAPRGLEFAHQRLTCFRRVTHQAHHARHGLDDGRIGHHVPQRAGIAEGRHGCHDDVRLDRPEAAVVHAQPFQHARGEVRQHHVADRGQPLQDAAAGCGAQVQCDAELVPVEPVEHGLQFGPEAAVSAGKILADHGPAQAHTVQARPALDLDHLRAHVRQQVPGHRPGPGGAQVHDADAAQRGARHRTAGDRHSPNTSALCCPSSGAGRTMRHGEPCSRTGAPG